ncbi:thioesterase family protein [Meridianimarinicoccus sp. RP-17]|uniref:thioesterase family protein n=1 Tax=Meridianimarinicoccus zhengii TaxID=2056810 RepID=UPI001F1DC561|nr:thioesterase family protein [Phycocomes zhengii]
MKPGLHIGDTASFSRVVTEREVVSDLFPDAGVLHGMPRVFATAYMVGLMEWACVEQIAPYFDDGEGSLGIHVDVGHVAPTPPGLTVTVESEVTAIEDNKLWFKVRLRDDHGVISEGRHARAVVDWARFQSRVDTRRAAPVLEAEGAA